MPSPTLTIQLETTFLKQNETSWKLKFLITRVVK
jgi:hypothetical protein